MDIGQGAGLAAASGVRPFVPALLAGSLARGDLGVDFEGSGWGLLESPGFLLTVLVLGVMWFGVERSAPNAMAGWVGARSVGALLGALLFAGSLAARQGEPWVGLAVGMACAVLGQLALGRLFEGARGRLTGGPANLMTAYAEAAALILAVVAIAFPPLAFLILAAFVLLLLRRRPDEDDKYAGLRVLR